MPNSLYAETPRGIGRSVIQKITHSGKVSSALNPRGEWDSSSTYSKGDCVWRANGNAFLAAADTAAEYLAVADVPLGYEPNFAQGGNESSTDPYWIMLCRVDGGGIVYAGGSSGDFSGLGQVRIAAGGVHYSDAELQGPVVSLFLAVDGYPLVSAQLNLSDAWPALNAMGGVNTITFNTVSLKEDDGMGGTVTNQRVVLCSLPLS